MAAGLAQWNLPSLMRCCNAATLQACFQKNDSAKGVENIWKNTGEQLRQVCSSGTLLPNYYHEFGRMILIRFRISLLACSHVYFEWQTTYHSTNVMSVKL